MGEGPTTEVKMVTSRVRIFKDGNVVFNVINQSEKLGSGFSIWLNVRRRFTRAGNNFQNGAAYSYQILTPNMSKVLKEKHYLFEDGSFVSHHPREMLPRM